MADFVLIPQYPSHLNVITCLGSLSYFSLFLVTHCLYEVKIEGNEEKDILWSHTEETFFLSTHHSDVTESLSSRTSMSKMTRQKFHFLSSDIPAFLCRLCCKRTRNTFLPFRVIRQSTIPRIPICDTEDKIYSIEMALFCRPYLYRHIRFTGYAFPKFVFS